MLSRAVAVLSAVMMLPAALGATAPDPGHCAVVTGSGICLVSAADPARPGGPSRSHPEAAASGHTGCANAWADAADER